MKKFFEKHDLIKIALGMILLTVILTWIIPQGDFSSGEFVKGEISRIGIFDLFTYGLLGIYYFTAVATFIFVLGGFYQFLSSLGAYQKLTSSIANKIKGKEIIFSVIISFVLAALASIINEQFVLVAFIPFIITIMRKAGLNKITSFVTTFGSLLVGVLGATVTTKLNGINNQMLGMEYVDSIWIKIGFFAAAFVVYSIFNVLYIKKSKNATPAKKVSKTKSKSSAKKDEVIVKEDNDDLFSADIENDNAKHDTLPLIIVGIITVLVLILAYIPWETVFGVDWFTKAFDWVCEFKLFGTNVLQFILGSVDDKYRTLSAFGSWDLFGAQVVMLVSTIILQLCYKKSVDSYIESFKIGFSKVSKLVVIAILSYLLLEFSYMFPVIPTIANSILGSKFNVFTLLLVGIICGLFMTEHQYSVILLGGYFATAYASNLSAVSFLLQTSYGLVSFLTPASALLLVGLSYFEIPYKDWFKYIWKFFILMLIAIILFALILF